MADETAVLDRPVRQIIRERISMIRVDQIVHYGAIVTGCIALLSFLCIVLILLFKPFEFTQEFKDVVMYVLATTAAWGTTTVNYFMGSSAGSARKDQALTPKGEPK